jgi:DNA-binding XRE family transcriptional regulator
MTGPDARSLRKKLGIVQARMAWDLQLDPGLISRWEYGYYDLKPETESAIARYLSQKLEEVRTLEFPKQVAQ